MLKKLLFSTSFLLISVLASAQTVTINESGGWLETAYVKWNSLPEAESYNVYYSGNGILNQKIDNALIRSYGSYFRADILGLAAGSYTIDIKPVISGVEGDVATTGSLTVLAHDRTGFAFANARVPGAYKINGTPKDGAVILYITEETKNTVSLNVTGANSNPCVGLETILEGFKKGNDNRPLILRLIGQITDLDYMDKGDIVIENNNNALSHITLEGVGNDAVADGWGIRVKNASNIEIRNIGTMNCNSDEGDNIGLQQNNDYIWVHNVDFFYGDAGGAADQAKGDGALDCKKSTYVTFSYNHFWDSGKCNLLGLSEGTTSGLYITYHHNWYDHSDSRHPRVRFYSAHVYNNYYDGNSKYGVGSTMGSSVFVENNTFRNCKYPILTSMQGSDVYNEGTGANDYVNYPTFSKEDGGTIKAFGNDITGAKRFVAYGGAGGNQNTMVDFDAVVASTRDEAISNSIISSYGSNTYNNFDTDAALYIKNLVPDSPADAKTKVMLYSGRLNGGDFNWSFNNSEDDTSYAVNAPLKAALSNYMTSLVYIQGEAVPSSQTLTSTTGNNDQNVQEGNAINPIIFTWGGDATDVTVNGLPASGVDFVKDATAKTITISGTPTSDVSYTVTTVGAISTPVSESGTITVGIVSSGDEIHNFTESGTTSTFYSITGNLSTSKGDAHYNNLTLTQCLKIESITEILFTTVAESTLTLVFNDGVSGDIKIDGVSKNFSTGVLTLIIPAGSHTITKDVTLNLYYMSVEYTSLGMDYVVKPKLILYPNPVNSNLHISSQAEVTKVQIYNLQGVLIKGIENNIKTIDMSSIGNGGYLIKAYTNQGVINRMIIKK
ncbi:T9SS type A sorting domain-containing protein [Thalassobellus suaedae]|uniref:T9SS type A sorting domain-containing protein n=1 Tax=Thalassobellus suaedae TaxID=3074124 RepID=A0ABY9XQI8_9FLAO|nr:T9SS type A sorting domain-containing protein [Flavobacteriaceae bacterium HL-DH14]